MTTPIFNVKSLEIDEIKKIIISYTGYPTMYIEKDRIIEGIDKDKIHNSFKYKYVVKNNNLFLVFEDGSETSLSKVKPYLSILERIKELNNFNTIFNDAKTNERKLCSKKTGEIINIDVSANVLYSNECLIPFNIDCPFVRTPFYYLALTYINEDIFFRKYLSKYFKEGKVYDLNKVILFLRKKYNKLYDVVYKKIIKEMEAISNNINKNRFLEKYKDYYVDIDMNYNYKYYPVYFPMFSTDCNDNFIIGYIFKNFHPVCCIDLKKREEVINNIKKHIINEIKKIFGDAFRNIYFKGQTIVVELSDKKGRKYIVFDGKYFSIISQEKFEKLKKDNFVIVRGYKPDLFPSTHELIINERVIILNYKGLLNIIKDFDKVNHNSLENAEVREYCEKNIGKGYYLIGKKFGFVKTFKLLYTLFRYHYLLSENRLFTTFDLKVALDILKESKVINLDKSTIDKLSKEPTPEILNIIKVAFDINLLKQKAVEQFIKKEVVKSADIISEININNKKYQHREYELVIPVVHNGLLYHINVRYYLFV